MHIDNVENVENSNKDWESETNLKDQRWSVGKGNRAHFKSGTSNEAATPIIIRHENAQRTTTYGKIPIPTFNGEKDRNEDSDADSESDELMDDLTQGRIGTTRTQESTESRLSSSITVECPRINANIYYQS